MITKKEFIWNTIGSIIVALFNAIILMFCTRINTIEIAGIFSIAYATAYIFNAIGDFGIRIYQVTDTNKKYNFSEYLAARVISIILMCVSAIIFIVVDGYRNEKIIISIILILYRIIENLSESFQAEFQLNGHLDIAGKSMTYRNIAALLTCYLVDKFTENFILALISMLAINLILFLLYDVKKIKQFTNISFKFNMKKVKEVIIQCLPLAISTLISIYVINSVKYAIDRFGNYTMQTYYNIIYMPTFVINLVSIFISKPFLKPFGEYWNNKEYKKLYCTIGKIIAFLFGTTVAIEIVCYFIGIPVLNILYKVDLSSLKLQLILLILSGFLYAISTILFNALGTMRKQKYTLIPYTLSAIFALIVPKYLVQKYNMQGAVISSILIMLILCITMGILFISNLKRKKEKNDEV